MDLIEQQNRELYATEDIAILFAEECMAISETIYGTLFFTILEGEVIISNKDGFKRHISVEEKGRIKEFLFNCYSAD